MIDSPLLLPLSSLVELISSAYHTSTSLATHLQIRYQHHSQLVHPQPKGSLTPAGHRNVSSCTPSSTPTQGIVNSRSEAEELIRILHTHLFPPPDRTVFWSGTTSDHRCIVSDAEHFASQNGFTTLEMKLEELGIKSRMPQFADFNASQRPAFSSPGHDCEDDDNSIYSDDTDTPFPPESETELSTSTPSPYFDILWGTASRLWAQRARGKVVVVLGDKVRAESVYRTVEIPELMVNGSVGCIEEIVLATGKRTIVK